MYELLVRLMLFAALAQAGLSLSKTSCHGRACAQQLEKAARDVLRVDWRPLSVFPEEGRRFR